ncbi:MAG TPA: N-acetylneuraminate synthase family protein, partial [Gaiellaceae bacterium]|nr:N-acetylneuraminate synthase family protein [Gaiellaceae bacterium]
ECYVIAEIGHNHQGSVEQAMKMIESAHACGADAVKLQKRDNAGLYTKEMFNRPYDNENSYGPTYGTHREALEFGPEEYAELKAHAAELGVTFFATAFDFKSAEMLAELDLPAYKIASGDLTNTPLLAFVAEIGRPMIVSTGGGTMQDVRRAYDCVASINPQVALLQCTAGYPVERWEELDLRVIETYRQYFPDAVVGYSGHDNGIAMPVAAYVLGARIVEKHFTLNRAAKGTDHRFSLEPVGLRKLVRDLQRTRLALGSGDKVPHPSEAEPITKMGKKIVAATTLPAGHVLRREDLALKSPADGGLPPYELETVIGRTLRHPISADGAVTLDDLDEVLYPPEQPAAAPAHDA